MRTILVEIAVALLVCFAAFIAWDKYTVRPVGSASVPAVEAPAVRRVPTAAVTVKAPVKVYKGDTKINLKLTGDVLTNPDWQIISAQQTPANLHPTTESTAINTQTGEVKSFVKTDPYPWLAYEPRGSIGLAYGYKYNHVMHSSQPVGRLQADYELVRVKALKLGLTATVDSDSTAFVGVGLKYQW